MIAMCMGRFANAKEDVCARRVKMPPVSRCSLHSFVRRWGHNFGSRGLVSIEVEDLHRMSEILCLHLPFC